MITAKQAYKNYESNKATLLQYDLKSAYLSTELASTSGKSFCCIEVTPMEPKNKEEVAETLRSNGFIVEESYSNYDELVVRWVPYHEPSSI